MREVTEAKSYKRLIVWQKSIYLVNEVYIATNKLPSEERFGLISQMRRSAVSVPSNIAEGYKRKSRGEYLQFLSIADASLAELETQIIICRTNYSNIDFVKSESLIVELQKMLFVLIKKLKQKPTTL